jgi:predicted permease
MGSRQGGALTLVGGLGLGYKLRVCPALIVALLWCGGVDGGMLARVSLSQAAMPPMNGAAVRAAQTSLAPRLASMMVGIGTPLGLCTSVGWFWLFNHISR